MEDCGGGVGGGWGGGVACAMEDVVCPEGMLALCQRTGVWGGMTLEWREGQECMTAAELKCCDYRVILLDVYRGRAHTLTEQKGQWQSDRSLLPAPTHVFLRAGYREAEEDGKGAGGFACLC